MLCFALSNIENIGLIQHIFCRLSNVCLAFCVMDVPYFLTSILVVEVIFFFFVTHKHGLLVRALVHMCTSLAISLE